MSDEKSTNDARKDLLELLESFTLMKDHKKIREEVNSMSDIDLPAALKTLTILADDITRQDATAESRRQETVDGVRTFIKTSVDKKRYEEIMYDEALNPTSKKQDTDNRVGPQGKMHDATTVRNALLDIRRSIGQELQNKAMGQDSLTVALFQDNINSLLNSDPRSENNKGKAVRSLKATEQSFEGQGLSPELQEVIQNNRKDLESQLKSVDGITSLIRDNIKLRTLQGLGFYYIDTEDNPTGLGKEAKDQIVNSIEQYLSYFPENIDVFLKDKDLQQNMSKALQPLVNKIFGPDTIPKDWTQDIKDVTIDPEKLKDPKLQKQFAEAASKSIAAFVAIESELATSTLDKAQKATLTNAILSTLVEDPKLTAENISSAATRHAQALLNLQKEILKQSHLNLDPKQSQKITNSLLPELAKLPPISLAGSTVFADYAAKLLKQNITLASKLRKADKIPQAKLDQMTKDLVKKHTELVTQEKKSHAADIEKNSLAKEDRERWSEVGKSYEEINAAVAASITKPIPAPRSKVSLGQPVGESSTDPAPIRVSHPSTVGTVSASIAAIISDLEKQHGTKETPKPTPAKRSSIKAEKVAPPEQKPEQPPEVITPSANPTQLSFLQKSYEEIIRTTTKERER